MCVRPSGCGRARMLHQPRDGFSRYQHADVCCGERASHRPSSLSVLHAVTLSQACNLAFPVKRGCDSRNEPDPTVTTTPQTHPWVCPLRPAHQAVDETQTRSRLATVVRRVCCSQRKAGLALEQRRPRGTQAWERASALGREEKTRGFRAPPRGERLLPGLRVAPCLPYRRRQVPPGEAHWRHRARGTLAGSLGLLCSPLFRWR